MTVILQNSKYLHFSSASSFYDTTNSNYWFMDFEWEQDSLPIHNPELWKYNNGSIWRYGPQRMSPLICFREFIWWLQQNGYNMLARSIKDEVFEKGLDTWEKD